jgi:hypothetical protein
VRWARGGLAARWLGDGLLLEADGRVLVDPGLQAAQAVRGLTIDAVVIANGTPETFAGLVGVLSSSVGAISVWTPLWDDRASAFVEAWARTFPRDLAVEALADRAPMCGGRASLRSAGAVGAPGALFCFEHRDGRVIVSPDAAPVRADLAVHRVDTWLRPSSAEVWAIGPDGAWWSGPGA